MDQPTLTFTCTSEPNPTVPSGSVSNTERSPQQPPLKTVTVRLDDCRHKLGPPRVRRLREGLESAWPVCVLTAGSIPERGLTAAPCAGRRSPSPVTFKCAAEGRMTSTPKLAHALLKKHKHGTRASPRWPLMCATSVVRAPSNLLIHRRIHKGEKRFACALCERKFIQLGNLKVLSVTWVTSKRTRCGIRKRSPTSALIVPCALYRRQNSGYMSEYTQGKSHLPATVVQRRFLAHAPSSAMWLFTREKCLTSVRCVRRGLEPIQTSESIRNPILERSCICVTSAA